MKTNDKCHKHSYDNHLSLPGLYIKEVHGASKFEPEIRISMPLDATFF